MASFFRRKRSLIFKFIVGVPTLWFFIVIFLSYQDKGEGDDNSNRNSRIKVKERSVFENPLDKIKNVIVQPFNPVNPVKNDNDIVGGKDNKFKQEFNIDHRNQVDYDDDTLKFEKPDPDAPGEGGKAVIIEKEKLSPEERKKYDDGWQNNAFNQYASDMISLHRSLDDVRDTECKSLTYRDNLPDTSVVICFHNEAWTVLLRTFHSVLDRSPRHLIREIILVDDFSDKEHLGKQLEDYIAPYKKIKIVRTKQREGLIRARLLGYSVAKGDVVTFLDSHCECAVGWLEPLLDRIAANKSNVVCPVIDVIEDDSFKYQYGNARSTSIGGFDWNMQFTWHAIPDYERQRRNNLDYMPVRVDSTLDGLVFKESKRVVTKVAYICTRWQKNFGGVPIHKRKGKKYTCWLEPLLERIAQNAATVAVPVIDIIDDDTFKFLAHRLLIGIGVFDFSLTFRWKTIPRSPKTMPGMKKIEPMRSPTMAGGLFSISREYFAHIGTYDPGMDIWGGENLELSFRVWMCGGVLEIIPCSHVGHIFRKRSPYKWRGGVNVVKKNSVRLAEVWMDEYKNYYYERFNHDLGEFGDVSERKELRKRLNCKSFDWYVKNIYPDLFVPGEALASGEIRSKAKPMCVDSAVDSQNYHKPVNMWPCHNQGGNQYWMLSKNSEIRRDDGCLDYSGGESVIIYPCHGQKGNQEWHYREDNTLLHVNTNKCMEVSVDGQKLLMKSCSGIDRQIWKWKRKPADGVVRE